MSNELFRTCPESGLQFHKPAERLMKAHAVVAVVILLIGGIAALLVTLTRMPAIHLLPADRFYQLLTTHGVNMLIFWMISFEIAILYFCSSTLLRVRLATPKLAWVGFGLMLAGIIINNAAVATGTASVMMTSYVPMPANPNFYLGLILFAVGALIGCFIFLSFGGHWVTRRSRLMSPLTLPSGMPSRLSYSGRGRYRKKSAVWRSSST
jgi:cytochrome c oxidase subunit 1